MQAENAVPAGDRASRRDGGPHLLARIGDQGRQARRRAEATVRPGNGAHAVGGRLIVEENAAAAIDLQIDEARGQESAGRKARLRPIGGNLAPRSQVQRCARPGSAPRLRHASGDRQKRGPPGRHGRRRIEGLFSTGLISVHGGLDWWRNKSNLRLKDAEYPGHQPTALRYAGACRSMRDTARPKRNSMDRLGHSWRQTHRRLGPGLRREERGSAADCRCAAQLRTAGTGQRSRGDRRRHHARPDAGVRRGGHARSRADAGAGRRRRPQRAGALRHGPPHARQHSRAGAAAGPFRFGARVPAGRLRDRRAADRPASQGAGGARAPRSRSRPATFTRGPKATACAAAASCCPRRRSERPRRR